jgi:hypothetical protein
MTELAAEKELSITKRLRLTQLAIQIQNSASELHDLVANQAAPAHRIDIKDSPQSSSVPSLSLRRSAHMHPNGATSSAGSSTNNSRWVFRSPQASRHRECEDLIEEIE